MLYTSDGKLTSEEEDLCFTCRRLNDCPLINALLYEVVDITDDGFNISKCSHYEKQVSLRIIK